MGTCDRFEREFLSDWDGGDELHYEHLRSCPDCRERRGIYERIAAALSLDDTPPLTAGWEARVLEHVRSHSTKNETGSSPRLLVASLEPRPAHWLARRRWVLLLPFMTVAAGVLLF